MSPFIWMRRWLTSLSARVFSCALASACCLSCAVVAPPALVVVDVTCRDMRRLITLSLHRVTIIETRLWRWSFQVNRSVPWLKGASSAVHSRSDRANLGVLFSTSLSLSGDISSTPRENTYSRCLSSSSSRMPFNTFFSSKLPAVTTSARVSCISLSPNLDTMLAACSANLSTSRWCPSLSKHSAHEMMNRICDLFRRSSCVSSSTLKQLFTGRYALSALKTPASLSTLASSLRAVSSTVCVADVSISSSNPRIMVIQRASYTASYSSWGLKCDLNALPAADMPMLPLRCLTDLGVMV
mmetsp:Transcript_7066/g.15452  ORF Transcript_7066/g.15452 Transcript_7066/m.15452 type:complete len:298 (+) Transcript_7066:924-1817(+)